MHKGMSFSASFLLVLCSCFVLLGFRDTPLEDAELEARAMHLFEEIGCPVCEGQSLGGSGATLAGDMRNIIRNKIADGYTNEETIQFLEERYGTSIRLEPAFASYTALLWLLPVLFFIAALWASYARRSR